ncbi:MAG: multifunctional CCA tRNA nucleotidyl transferase/2'3'-cyclic phosphodiesterase/2'nucleotidase/phosphatase [Gammaproteobacteria bacterium]|nr:multifunctional CCA tRNA nucleotidyl transferase/2'3'-cyclic phosphodiesterase/2'nucleotidase/phosphatase [Gammaproteobacteria bacterium]
MEIYLVGGAVRDELLGLSVNERDWVVVGATPEEMAAQGFKPVGKDFPVFLHPDSHEEYALARTERKVARGYHGFQFYSGIDVTLEQDLKRRDLTINAMARSAKGKLIDPYGGQRDLEAKVMRHVSTAFCEDPVRLLRVCRFAARFGDFTIAAETMTLLKQMVENSEVAALVPERVFNELERALASPYPQRFFQQLLACEAFSLLFPESDRDHPFAALSEAVQLSDDAVVRFAATFCQIQIEFLDHLNQRLHLPNRYYDLCRLTIQLRHQCHQAMTENAETLLSILEQADFFRRPQRFDQLLIVCHADYWQQQGNTDYPQAERLRQVANACQATDTSMIDDAMSGREIAQMIRQQRLHAIQDLLNNST